MDDPVDTMAWKLDAQIQAQLKALKGRNQFAELEGKLLALSGRLTVHHLRYGAAVASGRSSVAALEAEAIGGCERTFRRLLGPPGGLDIQVDFS